MGAPKQKWTSEEESALRAGVVKHGAGKWRTILKDPEFNAILSLRSNVDLKDKWRNMSVTANGWGSREKARLALKRNHLSLQHDEIPMPLSIMANNLDDVVDAKPLAISGGAIRAGDTKRPLARLDNIIMEAITNLKDPSGANKASICMYIVGRYWSPPNFRRLLSAKLKVLIASGRLVKVKRKYRIPSSTPIPEEENSGVLLLEGPKQDYQRQEGEDVKVLTKSQIDSELAKMRNMNAVEAAKAAAQAVADAEAAMAEAEEAARAAGEAEADAEAAQVLADAAMMKIRRTKVHV